MSNELMILPKDSPLPESKKNSWLLLGAGKLKLDEELQKKELELQTINDLALYKSKWNDLVSYRKSFTGYLDNIKEKCMEVEKRTDPATNERYQALVKADLEERLNKQKEEEKRKEVIKEFADFRVHISNQLADQAFAYETECRNTINKQYILALEEHPENIVEYIEGVRQMLSTIKKPPLEKFKRTHVTDQAAKDIYAELVSEQKTFDWTAYLDEKFSMYENDKEAAKVVIEQEKIQAAADEARAKEALEQTKATTTLVGQADSYVSTETLVKTTRTIKIVDDSERWVMAIMSAFISNFQQTFPKIKNKKYSSLSVAQMAAALDAAQVEVKGIEYVTSHK